MVRKFEQRAAVISPAAGIGGDYASESYCIFRDKSGFPRRIQLRHHIEFSALRADRRICGATVMEALNDIPGLHKVRQPLFDGGNRHRLSLGQVVALEGHQANDGSRGGSMTKSALSRFCPPSSCCPFGDNTQASAKTGQSKLTPQFGSITQSGIPLRFKPRQVRFERGLPNPEDVSPLTTNDAVDQLSTMPGSAHDLLDGQTLTDEPADNGVCLFAPQISLVLQPLSGDQQFWIYRGSADCHPDLSH